MLPCDWCQKFGHVWFQCPDPKRPADWKPDRLTMATVKAAVAGVRHGAKFIAEVPDGTKMIQFGDKVIAAGPNTPASYVTDGGLVPIKPKRGRPKTITDMKAYKAEKARERRAAAREAKK